MDTASFEALDLGANDELRRQLTDTFGGYRAEWLGPRLYELFTTPGYLPEILTSRPCVLVGGRGTGKTTVLRGLSYEGRSALTPGLEPKDLPFVGFYYRVNTNRVAAFSGPEISDERWTRVFGHYLNLTLCEQVLQYLVWYEKQTTLVLQLPQTALVDFADSLSIVPVHDVNGLAAAIRRLRIQFESYINNIGDSSTVSISMLGQPIDILVNGIKTLSTFSSKPFFFLIDEYENFSDYQQVVCNTLIKHSSDLYTFKVGVRDLGLRMRTTLRPHEQLLSPADYEKVDIADRLRDSLFSDFAAHICNTRLRAVSPDQSKLDVRTLFSGLTEEHEALLLGVETHVRSIRAALREHLSSEELDRFDTLRPLQAYLIQFWATGQDQSLVEVFNEAVLDLTAWDERLANYQYAMLFTLRRGKRGLRKYYCGWNTFVSLSSGNIRYLLELVASSLQVHLQGGYSLTEPVEPRMQTEAAQAIGKKNLMELEGLAVDGAQLTKLILGLGRVFQVFARQAEGHAPEVNQFVVSDRSISLDPAESIGHIQERVDSLVRSSVMHLALVRMTGNKLAASSSLTKEDLYSLHPIFSPLFDFSHRKKRKMSLVVNDLVGLVDDPRRAIREILNRTHREPSAEMSEQLMLFASYFDALS